MKNAIIRALVKPFITSGKSGVSTRYSTIILGTILTVVGAFGWLTEDQIAVIKEQFPQILTAFGAALTGIITVYGIITKSSSDKAAEAAKEIDAKLPASAPVVIKTPGASPDIIVPGEDKSGR